MAISSWRGNAPIKRIVALRQAHRPVAAEYFEDAAQWHLISHLSLNYLSLVRRGGAGAAADPAALRLHRFALHPAHDRGDFGDGEPARISRGWFPRTAFHSRAARGSSSISTRSSLWAAATYLFASVIEQFLALYVSLNSFTQLAATVRQGREVLQGMATPRRDRISCCERPPLCPALRPSSVAKSSGPACGTTRPLRLFPSRPAADAALRRSRAGGPVRAARSRRRALLRTQHSGLSRQARSRDRLVEGEIPRIIVNFMGLTGPLRSAAVRLLRLDHGAAAKQRRTLAEFFDLFNHRAISLFYQAWEKYRFPVAFERDGEDRVSNVPDVADRAGHGGTAGPPGCLRPGAAVLYGPVGRCSRVPRWRFAMCWRTISRCRWRWSSSSARGRNCSPVRPVRVRRRATVSASNSA